PAADTELLAVHEALDRLARDYTIQAEGVKLRYFGGWTNEEAAGKLQISATTVKKYWAFARTWLPQEIREKQEGVGSGQTDSGIHFLPSSFHGAPRNLGQSRETILGENLYLPATSFSQNIALVDSDQNRVI